MPHFPKLWRGSRHRRAAAAEDRHLAFEALQESLERLEELDERVEALRLKYQPWAYGVTTGEIPVIRPPVTGDSARGSGPSGPVSRQ
jgi:hypothetical protein